MSKERTRHNKDYLSYTKPDDITILSPECEQCNYSIDDIFKCNKYPESKPNYVIWCEDKCPEFEEKGNSYG